MDIDHTFVDPTLRGQGVADNWLRRHAGPASRKLKTVLTIPLCRKMV